MDGSPCHRPPARLLLLGALGIVLFTTGGCAKGLSQWWHNHFKVGPNYVAPLAPVAPHWIETENQQVRCAPAADCDWWTVFNDPTLNRLIETAYSQNLDLRTAGARVLQARAQRANAVGNLFPQTQTLQTNYVHAQLPQDFVLPLPGTFNLWLTGFNASWEIDFWGRYRRTVEAAGADLDASVESYNDALVMLLSEVATSYVQLRTFEQRLQYAAHNVEIQQGSTHIAEQRFAQGASSELDVRQARSNLWQTQSLVPPLVAGRRQAADQLCILLGMSPIDLAKLLPPAPIPAAPPEVAVGIPADLLRRRPDIRRAEREMAAQCARIGIAEADLYPRFAFNGFVGVAADRLDDLFTPQSFLGLAAPMVSWNILNYGRITNNVRSQDAQFQATEFQYQQTVLTAQREVEDSLVGFVQTRQQAACLQQGTFETARSVELVVEQFQWGVTNFDRVYNVQSLLVQQQDQLAVTRGNIAANLIALYSALGGGWQHFANCPRGTPVARLATSLSGPPVPEEIPADLPPAQ